MLSSRSSGKRLWQDAKRRGVAKDIDAPIRKIVTSLNDKGFYTTDSCAGHCKYDYLVKAKNKGHITFDKRYLKGKEGKIKTTLSKSGLKNIKKKGNMFIFDKPKKRRK